MSLPEDLAREEQALIEELGVYFEKAEQMSPLSARIFAKLVLKGKEGTSFEELTDSLQASKSSISTNLQLLQQTGNVSYHTYPGDRKRYFRIDTHHLLNRIEQKIEGWKKEKLLRERVIRFKESVLDIKGFNPRENPDMALNYQYLEIINSMISNLEHLKNQLERQL